MDPERYQIHDAASTNFSATATSSDWIIPGQPSAASAVDSCSQPSVAFTKPAPVERAKPTSGFVRPTNNAGGLEAGITNGQPLVIRAAMKPISTLRKPLDSVNLRTKQSESAAYERSDVCAVSACSVIIENVVAFSMAAALVDKFGGDSIEEMQARWKLYQQLVASR